MTHAAWLAMALAVAGQATAAEVPTTREGAKHSFQPSGQVVIIPGQGVVAGGPGQAHGGPSKSAASWYIEHIEKDVDLTDDQKKAFTEIIEARDAALVEWRNDNSEALAAASAALAEAGRSRDRDAFAKAQKEYHDHYVPMHAIMQRYQTMLQNVLTAEQVAQQQLRRRDAFLTDMISAYAGPANLTPAQVADIHEALAKEPSPEAIARRLHAVIQQRLTPGQKAAVAKHRAMNQVRAMYARVTLTTHQQEQVEAICEELSVDTDLTPAEAHPILKQRVDALLTDEQKEAMQAPPGLTPPPATPAFPVAPAVHQPAAHMPPRMTSDPAIQELRSELQTLRREVDTLRKLIDASADKEPKQ